MKNWKTTLTGYVAAVSYLVYKFLTSQHITGEDFILATGLAGVGQLAKDKDVTGGTRQQ